MDALALVISDKGGVADTAAGFVIVGVPTRATRPTAHCSTTPSNARRAGGLANTVFWTTSACRVRETPCCRVARRMLG